MVNANGREVGTDESDGLLRRNESAARGRISLIFTLMVAVALVSRIPFVFAEYVLGFDDGVYLASVHSMRLGYLPFTDIFSSQGPLFLPILRFFDVLGGEAYWAPRVTMAVAAAAVVGGSLLLVIRRGPAATWTVGVVVALSGSVFLGTASVKAEGVALAFGLAAFGLVTSEVKSGWRPILAGLLLGVSISIKSLFLIPVALAVGWVVWRKYGLADLLRSGTAGLAVLAASFLLWGVADVWDQYVAFHLRKSTGRDPYLNAKLLVARAWKWDKPALATALAAGIAWLGSRRKASRGAKSISQHKMEQELVVGLSIWATLTLIVLLVHSPLFQRHSLFLLVPAILLLASLIHIPKWVALVATAGILLQVVTLAGHYSPGEAEFAAVRAVREDLPADSFVVTDEPGIAYLAGRAIPPNLVDPSAARIEAEYLTVDEVETGVYADETCGVLFWSTGFDRLGLAHTHIEGYETAAVFGPNQRLLERTICSPS